MLPVEKEAYRKRIISDTIYKTKNSGYIINVTSKRCSPPFCGPRMVSGVCRLGNQGNLLRAKCYVRTNYPLVLIDLKVFTDFCPVKAVGRFHSECRIRIKSLNRFLFFRPKKQSTVALRAGRLRYK